MIVYVESNFVLEVVLENEAHADCERIVELAEGRAIELRLPAYAVLEPDQTLQRRREKLKALEGDLGRAVRELKRSPQWRDRVDATTGLLAEAMGTAGDRWDEVRARLCAVATLLPLDGSTLISAERAKREFSLRLPDAVIYASVLESSTRDPRASIFVTRDEAFVDPRIVEALRAVRCDVLRSFAKARATLDRA